MALLFLTPYFIAAYNRFEVSAYATESIAYRWGHPSRAALGDTPPILPQGFTLSALQRQLVNVLEVFLPLSPGTLQQTLQFFSWGTFLVFITLFLLCLVAAARAKWLDASALVLVFLPWMAAVYGTGEAGGHYALVPDYYPLNAIIACAVTGLLALFIRSLLGDAAPPSLAQVAALGAALGLGVANKITWGVPCLVGLGLVLLSAPPLWSRQVLAAAVLAGSAALTLGFVLLAYYGLAPSLLVVGVAQWIDFMKGQQGSYSLGSPEFFATLHAYNYDVLYPVQGLILGFVLFRAAQKRVRAFAALALLGFISLLWMATQRPAGSTFWDINVLTLLLTASAALALPRQLDRALVACAWIAVLILLGLRAPPYESYPGKGASAMAAANRFDVFQKMGQFAGGRRQVVLFPSNEYAHNGVYELLLKAAADFPTWNVTRGQGWLRQYFTDLDFRHEYDRILERPADLSGSCLVWFDRPDRPPLATRLTWLGQLTADPAFEQITLPIFFMREAGPRQIQTTTHALRPRRLPVGAP